MTVPLPAPCCPTCPRTGSNASNVGLYCPRAEPERHARGGAFGPEQRRRGRRGTPAWSYWEVYDWRLGAKTDPAAWVPAAWVPAGVGPTGDAIGRLEPEIPRHPDYTDCCVDFGCCAELIAAAGMQDVFATLAGAAAAGGGAVALALTGDGAVIPLFTGPRPDEVL